MTQEEKDYIETTIVTLKLLNYDVTSFVCVPYELSVRVSPKSTMGTIGSLDFYGVFEGKCTAQIYSPKYKKFESYSVEEACNWLIHNLGVN